ncbi:hypothetical protein [Nonomuraea sp. KM88]|uniref:hypothetical protein n=1 Tax=Nonomuraea sp. KM88 TaxID=3457427 RepID=UPI003FCDC9CE
MKVELWSEAAFPWCGLGGHRLARAVEHVEVVTFAPGGHAPVCGSDGCAVPSATS